MSYTSSDDQFLRIFKNSIKINPRTISVKTLLSDRNIKRINYSPYYQRNYVWDSVKQSFFIESVILGTEIPPLIFFKSGLKIEVIDGRQRFETLKRFKDNEIVLNGRGLMSLTGLAKKSFNKLEPEKLKEVFLECNIRVFEFEIINESSIENQIEDEVKREIFRRYNTGITPLTSSEVDNAKYNDDRLSDLFKEELGLKKTFYNQVNDCFYGNDDKAGGVEERANYLRTLFIIDRFPITRYARGTERIETLDLLYEFATQQIEDFETEFKRFKDQISNVHKLYVRLGENVKNKFICECLFWVSRILESETVAIDYDANFSKISNHYIENLKKYARDDSHYYGSVMERFTDTGKLFQSLTNYDFSTYIRDPEFGRELKSIKASQKSSVQKTDEFDHLRINKPAPISTPIDEIKSDVRTKRYLIRPSYQRQERISELKASSIIESILLGINLPPIFVVKGSDGVKEVVDGQQRLLAIIGFLGEQYMDEQGVLQYSKNNAFKLKGLKILKELNSSNYNGLTDEEKDKILDFAIDVIIIDQSINPNFQPTDLFIRLNNKPYPIQQNSFEMWNSTVNAGVIQKIKAVTSENLSWFYSREVDIGRRSDRMENEELITILSFIKFNSEKDTYDKVLGLFLRKDRFTLRIKSKSVLSDFLNKLDKVYLERESFLSCIENTQKLIQALKELLGGFPERESLTEIFNVKGTVSFRRSFQDFYIVWLILISKDTGNFKGGFIDELRDCLGILKNAQNKSLTEADLKEFDQRLKGYVSH